MKITCKKQDYALNPFDDQAMEAVNKITENDLVIVELKRSRNPKYHGRAFAIFHELYDMVDESIGFEPWRKLMLIKAGYFTSLGKVSVNGDVTTAIEAKSMAYEQMEQDEFEQCFKDILHAFGEKYGRQLTLDDLERWSRY